MILNEKIDLSLYQIPQGNIRKFFFDFLRKPVFEFFIMAMILGNLVFLALDSAE
jgi:hypothetical protein